MVIFLITAAIRQYFVARHSGQQNPWVLVLAGIATIALAIAIAPTKLNTGTSQNNTKVSYDEVAEIMKTRCQLCHSATPASTMFTAAPAGIILDTQAQVEALATRIKSRVVDSKDMPFLNQTEMTDTERAVIAHWNPAEK